MAKSSKSHPTDSAVGDRRTESGVGRLFAGLQANRPRRWRFQPSVRFPAIGTKSGIALREKERRTAGWRFQEKLVDTGFRGALPYIKQCRLWRHNKSALSFDAEKEGAGCGAPVTGWRIGLILRAPCSAAPRTLPRETTCGGFWYFWPQKYKKKKVCENCNLPETSRSFSVKFRKTFFSAFRWRKAAKATRPIPMSASERQKAASGDCAGLQANRPRRCRFQPSVRSFAIGTKSGRGGI